MERGRNVAEDCRFLDQSGKPFAASASPDDKRHHSNKEAGGGNRRQKDWTE